MEKNQSIFLNSDYIVVEYMDLIKSPCMVLLDVIRRNDKIREILKLEVIENLDHSALTEWYINRKHQNFLIDLNRYPDQISESELDSILDSQLAISEKFYSKALPLQLTNMVRIMKKEDLTKDIIIYHPFSNEYAKNNLENELNYKFTVMNNFDKILDVAGYNSTYFLSNIDRVLDMDRKGVLGLSSVSIPIEYRYNKKNMTDYKIDLSELFRKSPFKISYFYACSDIINNEGKED